MKRDRLKRRARLARQHALNSQRLDRVTAHLQNSAAEEMRQRIETLVAARGRETLNTLLHGYAAGVLREALRSAA